MQVNFRRSTLNFYKGLLLKIIGDSTILQVFAVQIFSRNSTRFSRELIFAEFSFSKFRRGKGKIFSHIDCIWTICSKLQNSNIIYWKFQKIRRMLFSRIKVICCFSREHLFWKNNRFPFQLRLKWESIIETVEIKLRCGN